MKKINSLFFCILLILSTLSYSCSNKEATPAPVPTKTENLTRSPWKFQSATAGGTDISALPQLACFIDNILTFSSNLSFTISEGTTICSPSTAGNFTWRFESGETQLVLSVPLLPGGSTTFTLVSLNETNLVVSQNASIPLGSPPVLVVITFKH